MMFLKSPMTLVFGLVLLLQGCGTFVRIAYDAETSRLQHLRNWEAHLATLDCSALGAEYAGIEDVKDNIVDFDQRQDIMRDEMTAKKCPLPESLS